MVIATLQPDIATPLRYQIASPPSASVAVSDDDINILPRVAIASTQTTAISEGDSFVVTLTAADPVPTTPLAITLDVQETGLGIGYYNNYTPNPVIIRDGNPVDVTINTYGNDQDGDHGRNNSKGCEYSNLFSFSE